eukprot:CAMPEP_0182442946 /NCGR_PEP_ID=MMETSP1172-20130603/1802_1 /TAXON_ID=708627 /ORGANISM="Timspurckia oligopyrenoides, Strain CCMP3278" /LENGTH=473 /DNA_ID=CAMNT_0024638053 /DNA_START=58 /DNA_END=1479 /DNA_ORIENTATION=-
MKVGSLIEECDDILGGGMESAYGELCGLKRSKLRLQLLEEVDQVEKEVAELYNEQEQVSEKFRNQDLSPLTPSPISTSRTISECNSDESLDSDESASPVPIGIALSTMNVQSESLNSMDADVNLELMHTKVPDNLFFSQVLLSATPESIADAFSLPIQYVAEHWIHSETPVDSFLSTNQIDLCSPKYSETQRRKLHNKMSTPVNAVELAVALERCHGHQQSSCGFSYSRRHPDIQVSCENALAQKVGNGLYRSVQSNRPFVSTRNARFYVEFSVTNLENESGNSSGNGGLCIGVATDQISSSKMPGMESNSVGFYAAGDVIYQSKYIPTGVSYGSGDVIGILVENVDGKHSQSEGINSFSSSLESAFRSMEYSVAESRAEDVKVTEQENESDQSMNSYAKVSFYLNGKYVATSPELLETSQGPLFATVSMYHKEKKVLISCCPSELKYTSNLPNRCVSLCGQKIESQSLPASQ